MNLISIALIVTMAGPSGTQALQAKSGRPRSEQQVLAVVDQLTSAGLKRDVASLNRLYTDDYFHTNADGSIMTRDEVLASYKAPPKMTIDGATHDQDRFQIHGDQAVVNSHVVITGRAGEEPFTRYFRVTYVLRKVARRWMVSNSHATPMAQ